MENETASFFVVFADALFFEMGTSILCLFAEDSVWVGVLGR